MSHVTELIHSTISKSDLDDQHGLWLRGKCEEIRKANSPSGFFFSFGLWHQQVKAESQTLALDATDQFPELNLIQWTASELGRAALMTAIPVEHNEDWLWQLVTASDINEQIAIYKGLYLLENAADFQRIVSEGIRTNMASVFDAIALNNPFAKNHLDEPSWNQMVLKGIFMDRPIFHIIGLDERNNERLQLALVDYIHERWSAHRNVNPELWRLLAPSMDATLFEELKALFGRSDSLEQEFIAKAMRESNLATAKDWASEHGPETTKNWAELGALYRSAVNA